MQPTLASSRSVSFIFHLQIKIRYRAQRPKLNDKSPLPSDIEDSPIEADVDIKEYTRKKQKAGRSFTLPNARNFVSTFFT